MKNLNILMLVGLSLACFSQCQVLQPLQHSVCPSQRALEEDCVSWSEIASNPTSGLVQSNTALYFFPEKYSISSAVAFVGLENFSLIGKGDSPSHFVCTGEDSGIVFRNIRGLQVRNLKFSNCGAQAPEFYNLTGTSWYATSILILHSWNVDLHNVTVTDGKGFGVSGINVLGESKIRDSTFTNMSGGGGAFIMYVNLVDYVADFQHSHSISILNSNFMNNTCITPLICTGTGLHLHTKQTMYSVQALMNEVKIMNNQARGTAGMRFTSESLNQNHLKITNSLFKNNTVYVNGTSGFSYAHFLVPFGSEEQYREAVIEITASNFTQNIGHKSDNPYEINVSDVLNFVLAFETVPHHISIRDCVVTNNIGGQGVGLNTEMMNFPGNHNEPDVTLEVTNTLFSNNTSTAYMNYRRAIAQVIFMKNVTLSHCRFENNHGTAILAQSSNIYLKNINAFRGNLGSYGGGFALYKDAIIYLHTDSTTFFERNEATNSGGGIYISSTESLEGTQCAIQPVDTYIVSLFFKDNLAKVSGNDMFGGNLNTCLMGLIPGRAAMRGISYNLNTNNNSTLDFSSKPTRICHCDNEMPDCFKYIRDITTYPGKTFTVSLLAIGQLVYRNFSLGVPSAVYASIEHEGAYKLPRPMKVQGGKRTCSQLTYSVHSNNTNEIMILTTEEDDTRTLSSLSTYLQFSNSWYSHQQLFLQNLRIPVYINVTLLPCPFGFELSSTNMCECTTILQKLNINCSIDTLTFQKEPLSWIGTEQLGNSEGAANNLTVKNTQILIHHHCPFDYCNSESAFLLSDPDTQCSNNRSGILCGECSPGLSLVLGSSKCKKCSNVYLNLFFAFALAGIFLTVFLIFTDMTVATGMISGLLFYANVVNINKSSLFPPGTDHGVLFTTVAWLNLDLGIETCLYDGLDSYASAWLQFVFPLYVWLLAGLIIVASRYSSSVNRICGRNIVQVLATLFLLSYTKLQRAVISGLSFTFVDRENGNFAVWLLDGNIRYLHGKHVYLFVFTFLCLVGIILPYTLAVLLGPWLQSKTDHRVFAWVWKLKPLFDAYLGPFKNGLRFWAGLLLLARGLLLFVAAVNVLGDPSINLLSMSIISSLLVALVWQKGGVYRKWILSCLESFFLLNLTVISLVALYNKNTGGNQGLAISISVGSSVVVFILLLGYNLIRRMKVAISNRSSARNTEIPAIHNYTIDNPDNTMIDILDKGRDERTGIPTTIIDRPDHSLLTYGEVEMDSF